MRAARLSSSMIDRVLFDDQAGELIVCFRDSGKYIYSGVPRAIYDSLRNAASAGAYFNRCIKGRFRCRPDPERRRFRPVD